MLKIPLWERMVLQRLFMQACAISSVLAALLVILDFGLQASTLLREVGWKGIPLHYLLVLSKRLPLLLSLSTVIAGIQTAFYLVKSREWLALVVGGISGWRLLRPFALFMAVTSLFLAANSQWLQPTAVDRLDALEAPRSLLMAQIDPQTTLLCRQITGQRLEEVFWISDREISLARTFDLRSRNTEGLITIAKESAGWQRLSTPNLNMVTATPLQPRWQAAPWAESQSLSRLLQLSKSPHCSPKTQAVAVHRVTVCFLPFISLAMSLPGILVYRRNSNWTGPLLIALVTVLGGMTLLESAAVLSGLGAVSPMWSFGPLLCLLGGTALWRWVRWQP